MNAIVHQCVDFLRFVGLRDRLRCPNCSAVGTWKPHGGWFDFSDERKVRRWLCKWCGYYLGPEGQRIAVFRQDRWVLHDEYPFGITPQNAVQMNEQTAQAWPWRG